MYGVGPGGTPHRFERRRRYGGELHLAVRLTVPPDRTEKLCRRFPIRPMPEPRVRVLCRQASGDADGDGDEQTPGQPHATVASQSAGDPE